MCFEYFFMLCYIEIDIMITAAEMQALWSKTNGTVLSYIIEF